MAPSKPPVFAVCGGISVETVVTGAGRRRSSVKARRSETTGGLAESLYADLLWDCGGANVENEAAPGLPLPTDTAPDEDFTDVFGGPPKFATLSFKRNMAKRSDTCFSGVSIFPSFVSAAPAINRTSVFNVSNGQPRLCSSQEAPGNPTSLSNSAKSTKPRLTTEAEFSSRICYSDSDKKVLINPKEEAVFRGEELSTMVPQERTGVKTSSTSMRRRESSRSDGGEDIKDSRGLKPSRKDFATMKENIKESSMGPGGDVEGQLASTHTRMASSSRGFQETSEKLVCSAHNIQAEGRRHNLKIKKKGKSDDLWVTIKDIQFATEPSRFPPPSRPPPCPRLHSDAACIARDTSEAVKSVDDCPVRARQMSQKESFSDSGSLSSTYTQESYIKITSDSKDIKDAMEMAEAKIRMVLEAREKAKLMVEKKVREKQRARQHKATIATEGKLGKEHDCKEHMRDLGGEKNKSNARHCEEDVDKQDEEGLRKRDSARKCIERATREVRSKSAAVVQERAAEFRASHDISDRPVEDANEDGLANSAINSTPAESTPWWSDTNVDLSKRLSHKAVPAKVVHEDDFFISREQQQDSLSSSWCYTERKRFCEAASLGKMGSMPRIREDLNLFPGGFQEIIGETDERRKARWDRHCQTAERMAKALEEKKLRDLERQKEQAERHRAGEMLDEEIKGWAAGKEGNLEALLCSLHYVLWPECGWVQVSPADLTSAAAVKKAYRRAALCVHPDKVQQKGATVAQKYIAEKIFDLLKEASAKSM